jgi:hypothetical protein
MVVLIDDIALNVYAVLFPLMKKEPKKSRLPIISLNLQEIPLSCPDRCTLWTLKAVLFLLNCY